MKKFYWVLLSSLFLLHLTIKAQSKRPMAGKEPSWVTMQTVDYNDTHLDHDAEDGTIDILYDQEVFPAQQSFYCHKIMRILTETFPQNKYPKRAADN